MASSREYIDYSHLLSKKDVRDLVQESEAHVIQEITALVTSNAEIIGILEKLIKDIDRIKRQLDARTNTEKQASKIDNMVGERNVE